MCFAGRFRAQIWFNDPARDATPIRWVIIEAKLSLGFGRVLTILKGGEYKTSLDVQHQTF